MIIMAIHIIIGNIFSLLAAICLIISVVKKNKSDLVLWQLWSIIMGGFSCLALRAYAALITCIMDMIRNILAYKNKLTFSLTMLLVALCIIVGLIINNLGLIGILAITASASYTIFLYITKNAQQMRWALISNLILWFVHDIYVQAYPSALTDIILSVWTFVQILKYRKNNALRH